MAADHKRRSEMLLNCIVRHRTESHASALVLSAKNKRIKLITLHSTAAAFVLPWEVNSRWMQLSNCRFKAFVFPLPYPCLFTSPKPEISVCLAEKMPPVSN